MNDYEILQIRCHQLERLLKFADRLLNKSISIMRDPGDEQGTNEEWEEYNKQGSKFKSGLKKYKILFPKSEVNIESLPFD
jgi:hypothetical protein